MGANNAMTANELKQYNSEQRSSKIYRGESLVIGDNRISDSVGRIANTLEAVSKYNGKISLSDTDAVKGVSVRYIQSCADTSTLPTITGLARALGVSRQAIYKYVDNHPNDPTSEWVRICSDAFSEALSEAAARGNTNAVVSIFLLKAMYGYREEVTIKTETTDPLDRQNMTAAEIIDKYKYLPDD